MLLGPLTTRVHACDQALTLLLGQGTGERGRLSQLACAHRVGADRLGDLRKWPAEKLVPTFRPPRVNPVRSPPPRKPVTCVLDHVRGEPLGDEPVIGEALELGITVGPRAGPREKSVDIGDLVCAPPAVVNDSRQRAPVSLVPRDLELLEQRSCL